MTQQDDTADGDPLLVRPYIHADAPRPSAQTWPAAPPANDADATVVLPRVAATDSPAGRRKRTGGRSLLARAAGRSVRVLTGNRSLLALAGAGFLVLLLGVAGLVAANRSGGPRTPQSFHDVTLPPWSTPVTGTPEATVAEPPAPADAPRRTTADRTSTGRATSAAAATSASSSRASAAPASSTSAAPSASAIAPPSPEIAPVDRTGIITGTGGRCLDLNGGVVVDGNHVQVFACNGTTAQAWTLAADGTLRVSGKCAGSTFDSLVRIAPCDTAATTARWRPGTDGTLANVATGDCLTAPSEGRRTIPWVRTDDCDGDPDQRWRFP
ncbi:ricin-type beta-trefoil lectin domain protein [Actinoplanes sp. NPDC051494]|uniref:ricin-type beta-trefoil lectin domain protein n=1 Tax=Actinoplanes sp. NPDC051494 TaxID=3363907 RepID=UPI00379CBBCB